MNYSDVQGAIDRAIDKAVATGETVVTAIRLPLEAGGLYIDGKGCTLFEKDGFLAFALYREKAKGIALVPKQ